MLHPHTETLIEMDSTIVGRIQGELTEKASGVFLWVILACRSLIQGFAAYDTPEELQQRLKELPPELNDLFKHILQRFEPRYCEHAAKLLCLCYHSTNMKDDHEHPHEALFTLGLALADADNLDITKPLQYKILSQEYQFAICKSLGARLRSRCCGLLEVRLVDCNTKPGFCQSRHLHHTDQTQDPIVESTVEFIHRSLFEFLQNPEVWNHEYLHIDAQFYPDAVLSRVNAHLLLASIHSLQCHRDPILYETIVFIIEESLLHLRKMDLKLKDGCTAFRRQALPCSVLEIVNSLKLLGLPLGKGGSANLSSPLDSLSYQLGILFSTSKISCTDVVAKLVCELSMETMLQHIDVSRYGDRSSPLLLHAIGMPLIQSMYILGNWELKYSQLIVKELILRGCDVNEVFVDHICAETTPWIQWLNQSPPNNYKTALEDSFVAEEFLSAGADIYGPVDRFKRPMTVSIGQRIFGNSLEEIDIDGEGGGFNLSHRFYEENLRCERSLRSSCERVRKLLRDRARQHEDNIDINPIPRMSSGWGCDEASGLKRRIVSALDFEENEYPSVAWEYQPKRRRACAELDAVNGNHELT